MAILPAWRHGGDMKPCGAAMAQMGLTKRRVETAPPGRHYDNKTPGFGLYVGSDYRALFFEYRPPVKGGEDRRKVAKRRISFGRYLGNPGEIEEARDRAIALLAEVRAGRDPRAPKDEAARKAEDTVESVVTKWLAADQKGNRSAPEVARIFASDVLPAWRERPIDEIRKRDVIALVDRVAERAPIKANRTLAHIRRFFAWAAGRDLVEVNPAQYVEKPTPEVRRDRVLSDAEIARLWHALDAMGNGPYSKGVKLLLLTGARREEVFQARWSELSAARNAIELPAGRSKSKTGRTIWLPPLARRIVASLDRYEDSDWLLTQNGKSPYTNFGHAKSELDRVIAKSAARAAGIEKPSPQELAEHSMPPWRLHDLRRTVATNLQRLGVRLEVTEVILGHISGSRSGVVGVYQTHNFREEARRAATLWHRRLIAITKISPK